jgi:hypothetical protein
MSTKQAAVPELSESHSAPAKSASTPPWDSHSTLTQSADYTRLGEQIQDLKNVAYASMAPDNQARLDAILTTYTTIRAKQG